MIDWVAKWYHDWCVLRICHPKPLEVPLSFTNESGQWNPTAQNSIIAQPAISLTKHNKGPAGYIMPSIGGHKIGARNLLGLETRKMLWMLYASIFEMELRNFSVSWFSNISCKRISASIHWYRAQRRSGIREFNGTLGCSHLTLHHATQHPEKWAATWSHPACSILNRNRPDRRTSPFIGQTSWPIILYRRNIGDHLAFQLYRALVFPVSLFLVQCNARQVGTSSSFKVHMHIWSLSCAWRFHDVGHSLRPFLKFDTRMTSHKFYERARG